MPLAPIALFVYNRPGHAAQALAALAADPLAKASPLYVFSDGPRTPADADAVARVREEVGEADGFKSVTVIEREANLGLARSVIAGVSQVCTEFGQLIVLEDDMVVSPHFLAYMNSGLERYRDDARVISVHGYSYPVGSPLPETFFLKGTDCWGWATWTRGWALFEPDGRRLLERIRAAGLEDTFNFNGAYDYVGMLEAQVKGRNDSWAVRWYASALLADKLTLYPGRSLVRNIGYDGSGTHCHESRYFETELAGAPVSVGPIPVEEDADARRRVETFLRRSRPPWPSRIRNRLSRLVRFG